MVTSGRWTIKRRELKIATNQQTSVALTSPSDSRTREQLNLT